MTVTVVRRGPQHHAEELLSEVQHIGLRAVLSHQQPSGEPSFMFVETIAIGELTETHGLLLHEFQYTVSDLFILPEDIYQFLETVFLRPLQLVE